jgi:small-conductance mechanosensitive channel
MNTISFPYLNVKFDEKFHRHFPVILFWLKVSIIVITLGFLIFEIVYYSSEKQDIPKTIQVINTTLFYLIGVFVILLCVILCFVLRKNIFNVFTYGHSKKKKVKQTHQVQKFGPEEKEQHIDLLQFYLSLCLWLNLYFIVVMVVTLVAIGTKNYSLITYVE